MIKKKLTDIFAFAIMIMPAAINLSMTLAFAFAFPSAKAKDPQVVGNPAFGVQYASYCF